MEDVQIVPWDTNVLQDRFNQQCVPQELMEQIITEIDGNVMHAEQVNIKMKLAKITVNIVQKIINVQMYLLHQLNVKKDQVHITGKELNVLRIKKNKLNDEFNFT
jgi:hypothetical protein